MRLRFLSMAMWTALALMTLVAPGAKAQGDPAKAFDQTAAAVRPPGTTLRIDLIGDSTQTDHAGYGRGFCANLTAAVDCVNMAKGGASTKTFREQGLWERSLETKPDYMLIQFGHNDDSGNKPPVGRQTTMAQYEANLRAYVAEARAAGIKPILVTPLTRRYFGPDGKVHSDLIPHADTMKKVAAEMHVPLIDLHADSIAYLDGVGEDQGNELAITKKDPSGKTIFDKTHLNWKGSYIFGRIVAVDLKEAVPELAQYVRPIAAPLPPEGLKAMRIINGAPVKIVLVGDGTVAAPNGWGPSFCAILTPNVTCVDDAVDGSSSKSFLDQGNWTKALAQKGDYYLIQFGQNDMRQTIPEASYAANLQRYIADARAVGAVPAIVTPVVQAADTAAAGDALKTYAAAARQVGMEEYVTVVDLNGQPGRMPNRMAAPGDTGAGKPDPQALLGRMVADNLVRTAVELGPDVIGQPAGQMRPATAAPR